jgi:hypothetical protein
MSIKKHITTILTCIVATSLCAQTGQIDIPRIVQMPNQPAPYNLRNWKQVAQRYDSFIYDLQKTGQYLPLVYTKPAGVNYPQNPAFGLHTYVGTNSPMGNEAINVLPSLVGATLAGADKTNQFGRNWLLMSQDFFNKNNGEQIYLNNAGGGSGSDWWYDLMPNLFFYQLYDLYPDAGGDADAQFTTIADRFLASVKALGGKDAPWQKANMNYRAFNFKTMIPNPDGVHEPEAAGAYAWVLYNAYQNTGNTEYLKAAEWSMEFLSDLTENPSYELQLPYGTYTAAKMNAETGTRYDVEKMVNWSFNKGQLRGWGTITGTWGGFSVAGLVGEANDAGNDYAFQLNGVQQAAALVPMVRYDKRFARAIGKWVLNLANATRLFYPGFLPNNLQDASAWSNVNDPDRVMGYEALREKWQSLSPYSTGDALGGNWAATNLALYGTGSIGYLGSMIESTNVDKILKINLLKTDFFGSAAYPTYLYCNSYNVAKSVQIDLGNTPVDVYDALSETFLFQNVSGLNSLIIPANQALMVVLCPAGGAVTYDQHQMLVDGVVVDFSQTAQPYQRGPRIQAVAAANTPVEFGQSATIFAKVQTGDSGIITYTWSTGNGTLSGTGDQVQWTAPSIAGDVVITLVASDGNGLKDTAFVNIAVVPEINKAPVITAIEKNVPYLDPNGVLQLQCFANDPNNDPITFTWTSASGGISGTGNTVEWAAPAATGIYEIKVKVTDNEGLFVEATTKILVKVFAGTGGNLIAYYPFSGNANDLSGNQLNGQASGTAYVADIWGNSGQASYFNGVNSRITVPVQPILNFQDAITVSCWFNAADLPNKESFLLSHGSWQNRWKISFTPDKKLRWTVNTLNAVADLDTDIPLVTDSFYYVTTTYDGQLLAIYLNGQLHSYKTLTGKIRTANVAFLLGQMLPGETAYNFKGTLDEVKIYDYALTPTAVGNLYTQASTGLQAPTGYTGKLVISPNPFTDQFHITFPGNIVSEGQLNIFDLTGRLVFTQKVLAQAVVSVITTGWNKGIYTIQLTSNKGFQSERLIKVN